MNPRSYSERALLGALLLDPDQVDQVSGWLEPADFFDPHHKELYRIMREMRRPPAGHRSEGSEQPADVKPRWAINVSKAAHGRTAGLTGSFLHTLMHTCPHPSHAIHYANQVIQADTHRLIATEAHRIAQALNQRDIGASQESLPRVFEVLAAARKSMVELADRWGAEKRPIHATLPAVFEGEHRSSLQDRLLASLIYEPSQIADLRGWLDPDDLTSIAVPLYKAMLQIDRTAELSPSAVLDAARALGLEQSQLSDEKFIERYARPAVGLAAFYGRNLSNEEARHRREDRVLATAINTPHVIEHISHWLRPDDFTSVHCGPLYQLVLEMHKMDGVPVDPVTVLWEAYRRGIVTENGLSASDFMSRYSDGDPRALGARLARQVLETATELRVAELADRTLLAAHDARPSAIELISHVTADLSQATSYLSRWEIAGGPGQSGPLPPPYIPPPGPAGTPAEAAQYPSAPHQP